MRAVRFYEYGGPEVLRFEEVPAPEPSDGEVLLRVITTSVRRTDLEMHAGMGSYFRAPVPFQLGRESSGVVAGLGGGVTDWKEGDEVITRNITPCGSCDNCRRDLPETCRKPRYQGVSAWGGYADYITIPARSLIRKPAEVGHDQGAGQLGRPGKDGKRRVRDLSHGLPGHPRPVLPDAGRLGRWPRTRWSLSRVPC